MLIDSTIKLRADESRPKFSIGELRAADDIRREWGKFDLLAAPQDKKSPFLAAFACSDRAVHAAQALRFEVFNLELDEGFEHSYTTGRDEDELDAQMTHLLLLGRDEHGAFTRVIGTYRMQTIEQALAGKGIYSAQEYDLAALEPYFEKSIELGRACIADGHRSFAALLALWLGIGTFMNLHGSRWLFGCCSITTREPNDGWRTLKTLRSCGYLHPAICVSAREPFACGPDRGGEALPLPKLFNTYMKLGAKAVSEPAIDRAFGTVDFLVMMDSYEVAMSSLDVVKRS